MKSPMVKFLEVDDPENYSDLKVLHSAAGYYVGTIYTGSDGFEEPGSRDSGYFGTKEGAEKFLKELESGSKEALAKLRMHP